MLDKESGWEYFETLNCTPDEMELLVLEVRAKTVGSQISSKKKIFLR